MKLIYIIETIFILQIFFLQYVNLKNKKKLKKVKKDIYKYKCKKQTEKFFKRKAEIKRNEIFLQLCKEGKLLSYIPKEKLEIKISIFLPTYNKENFIPQVIRSIQNQSFKNLEIIFVDDCSKDKSNDIIKYYMKKDKRIRLVKNERNRGVMYTRLHGVKNSLGKFAIALDPDDMYASPDILEIIYNAANKYNLDIVQFNVMKGNIGNYIVRCNKFKAGDKKLVIQPRLEKIVYKHFSSRKKTNILIWDKLINRNIYMKVAKEFNKIKFLSEKRWNYFDDRFLSYMSLTFSNRFMFIDKLGYFYNMNNESLWVGNKDKQKFNIYYLNCLYYVKGMNELTKWNKNKGLIPLSQFYECLDINNEITYNNIELKLELIKFGRGLMKKKLNHRQRIKLQKLLSFYLFI